MQTIIITGGTGGIGYQAALALARQGHRVVVTGRNAERGGEAVERLKKDSGNAAIELALGDLSTPAGTDALFEDLSGRFDRIDLLINNAGSMTQERTDTEDGYSLNFAVNVVAVRRLTLGLLPLLEAARPARVVNVRRRARRPRGHARDAPGPTRKRRESRARLR